MKKLLSFFLIGILLTSTSTQLFANHGNSNYAFAQSFSGVDNIGSYAVYGLENVKIDKYVAIQSGNIGIHDDSKKSSELEIKKDVKFADPESSIVANKIKIEKEAVVPNVYYNKLDNKGTVLGTKNTPLEFPIVNNLPEFPEFDSGHKKIKVEKNRSISLPSGNYGQIELEEGSVIIFKGGTYNLESIQAKEDSKILFELDSEIRVKQDIRLQKHVTLGPHPDSKITASNILFYVGNDDKKESKIEVGENSKIFANFYSPHNKIEINDNTIVVGSLVAKEISIKKSSIIEIDSAFNPISGLVEKYQKIILKLGEYDDFMDESLLTNAKSDLNDLHEIVDTLQELGVIVTINAEHTDKTVGNVFFFDPKSSNLFQVTIPTSTLSVLDTLAVIDEFSFANQEFASQEIDDLLNMLKFVLPEIIISDDEDFSKLFVASSVCISVKDALTCASPELLENSGIKIAIDSSISNILGTDNFFLIANAVGIGDKLRSGIIYLMKSEEFQDYLNNFAPEFLGSEIADAISQSINVSGLKFEDLDFNLNHDVGEALLSGWTFTLSEIYLGQELPLVDCPLLECIPKDRMTTGSDGKIHFSEIPISLLTEKIILTEVPTAEQLSKGWVNTTPLRQEVDVDHFNLPLDNTFDQFSFGNRQEASVIVITQVENNDGGTLEPRDFTNHVSDMTNAIPFTFAGQSSVPNGGVVVKLTPGTYKITQDPVTGYTTEYSDGCLADEIYPIEGGTFRTCIITNSDIPLPGTLIVINKVINDEAGTLSPGDFTLHVTGNEPSPAEFAGVDGTVGSEIILTADLTPVGAEDGYLTMTGPSCAFDPILGVSKNGATVAMGPRLWNSNISAASCYRAWTSWNISSIPDGAQIIDTKFTYQALIVNTAGFSNAPRAGTIYSLEHNPVVADPTTLRTDIRNGTQYVVNDPSFNELGIHTIDLGPLADAELESNLANGWFGIGISHPDESTSVFKDMQYAASEDTSGHIAPKLSVTYIPPGTGTPTTGGVTVTLQPGAFAVSEDTPITYTVRYEGDCTGEIASGETKTCVVINEDRPEIIPVVFEENFDDGNLDGWNGFGCFGGACFTSTTTDSAAGPAPSAPYWGVIGVIDSTPATNCNNFGQVFYQRTFDVIIPGNYNMKAHISLYPGPYVITTLSMPGVSFSERNVAFPTNFLRLIDTTVHLDPGTYPITLGMQFDGICSGSLTSTYDNISVTLIP